MKNPHGVKPTRYKKRKGSEYAIYCDAYEGPIFGNGCKNKIFISVICNRETGCSIRNNSSTGYVCDSKYKSSLFVNTAGPDEENYFSVLDYEVFTHN